LITKHKFGGFATEVDPLNASNHNKSVIYSKKTIIFGQKENSDFMKLSHRYPSKKLGKRIRYLSDDSS